MGASGKRHIGAIGMTPQRVQGAQQKRRAPSPQSRLLILVTMTHALFFFLLPFFLRAISPGTSFRQENYL
jgi:hypothetical protein